MVCNNCGTSSLDQTGFCTNCGMMDLAINNQYINQQVQQPINQTYTQRDQGAISVPLASQQYTNDVVTVKEWILAYISCIIPFWNLWYLLTRAFGKKYRKPSLRTWAKAQIVLTVLVSLTMYFLTNGSGYSWLL